VFTKQLSTRPLLFRQGLRRGR